MEYTIDQTEERNRRIGLAVSAVVHFLLLLFLFFFLVTYPDPPPGPAGVLVSFGEPEVGQGDEPPLATAELPDETQEEANEEASEPEVEKPEPEPKPEPKKTKVSQSTKSTKVLTDDRSQELAIKKEKERKEKAAADAKRKKEQAEQEAKERAEKEAADEARRIKEAKEAKEREAAEAKAAAEAKKKAEAERLRNQIGSAFGSGNSQGNSGTPGDAGQPDGDPDGKALEGISTGSGEIGGGLSGRKVLRKPTISDSSQKTGDVVVRVCVDSNGKVTSAKYTQSGSTTTDSRLVTKAIAGAKKYTFSKGDIEKQCGTIKIKFRVR